jgi:hypothetical protein
MGLFLLLHESTPLPMLRRVFMKEEYIGFGNILHVTLRGVAGPGTRIDLNSLAQYQQLEREPIHGIQYF